MVEIFKKLEGEYYLMEEIDEVESLKKTKRLLLKWKNDKNIQKLKEFYDTKSFSRILGVERREMSHSNFIAWILNDKEDHHLGQFAIKQLFDMILEHGEDRIKNALELYNKNNTESLKFDNLYKALMLNTYSIEDLEIGIEKVLIGGRIDIIVSMTMQSTKNDMELAQKVNIIIENKVDSSEHSNQTTTYYEYYTRDEKYKNDLNLFVFLLPVPTSKLLDKLADCEHFINLNYQLLSNNIFERALELDISERVKFIINEYLLSLRKPANKNKGVIMAIGKLEEELLIDFWEQHSDLIEAVAEPTMLSDNVSEENKDKATAVSNSLKIAKIRYDNLEDYIVSLKKDKKSLKNEVIENLRKLISMLEKEFQDTIEITYAPSKINIKNLNSNKRGKVFVYISIYASKIGLVFIDIYDLIESQHINDINIKRENNNNNNLVINIEENNSLDFKEYLPCFRLAYKKLEE